MTPSAAGRLGALVLALVPALVPALAGCDSPAPPTPAPKPTASATLDPYVPPPPEGCARGGSLDAVENDPSCVVARVPEGLMRDAMKRLRFTLDPDAPAVLAGGTVILRLAIVNASDTETSIVFAAQPPSSLPRPDWTRLAGVPEPKPAPSSSAAPSVAFEGYRLLTPVRTLDSHDRSVDGLPSTPPVATATPRLLRVRMKPRGRLTQTLSWWALRIPVPAPITRDDAGHRYVPKTAPVPLPPGEYTIAMDLPLHDIVPPESTVTARIKVDKVEKADKADKAALDASLDASASR